MKVTVVNTNEARAELSGGAGGGQTSRQQKDGSSAALLEEAFGGLQSFRDEEEESRWSFWRLRPGLQKLQEEAPTLQGGSRLRGRKR